MTDLDNARDREKLDWRVPKPVWERFRDFAYDKYTPDMCECGDCEDGDECPAWSPLDGFVGRAVEDALKEYTDRDGGQRVESLIDRLVQAAGRNPEREQGMSWDGETERVTVHVDPILKEEIRKETDGNRYGKTVARAMDVYMNGGRYGRCEEKLERVVEDAEELLAAGNNDTDDGMSAVERRTVKIAQNLNQQFTEDRLVEEIKNVAGDSTPTINKYRERVTEYLDVVPHPTNQEIWMPEENAMEIAGEETPRVCRIPVERLNRTERAERIRYEAGLKAAQPGGRNGRVELTVEDVRSEALQDVSSKNTTRKLMSDAADIDGYTYCTGETATLRVNLHTLKKARPALVDEIGAYRDGGEDDKLDGQTPPDGWFSDAVEHLSDIDDSALERTGEAIAETTLAMKKYPDEVDEERNCVSEAAREDITDERIQEALEEAMDDDTGSEDADDAWESLARAEPAD